MTLGEIKKFVDYLISNIFKIVWCTILELNHSLNSLLPVPASCKFTTCNDGASRELRLLPQPSFHRRIRESLRERAFHRGDGGELSEAVAVQELRPILDTRSE